MATNTNMSITGECSFSVPVPEPENVRIEDVAWRLSKICRFNGGTNQFFSVAQHCVEVSMLVGQRTAVNGRSNLRAALAGLLHDAPEAYYGDCISPVKVLMGQAYRDMRAAADAAVYAGLGVTDVMAESEDVVRWADLEMLVSDAARWDVFGNFVDGSGKAMFEIAEHNVVPPPFELRFAQHVAMSPDSALASFMAHYRGLCEAVFGKEAT